MSHQLVMTMMTMRGFLVSMGGDDCGFLMGRINIAISYTKCSL